MKTTCCKSLPTQQLSTRWPWPADPNHLHYYIWKWYAQISCGSDEVVRHAIAGEVNNDIKVTGKAFSGDQRYRLSSWNRTQEKFVVLAHASEASGTESATISIPSMIETGRHYNNEYFSVDFRGEGYSDGDAYYARIITKDISSENGDDVNPVYFESAVTTVNGETLTVTVPKMNRFTAIEFIKRKDQPTDTK